MSAPAAPSAPAVPSTLTVQDLIRITRRSEASLYRDIAMGYIPQPCRLGRALRWPAAIIQDWIDMGMPDAAEFEARRRAARAV